MGLSNNAGSITYLNMKGGKFAKKNADGNIQLFDAVDGVITGVEFKDDEYNGTKFRKLLLTLDDNGERFLVQVRTDSGYFRGLTNAVANADITQNVRLVASSKTGDNGKPQTTIFVSQHGKALKWKWNKDNQGDLPPLEKVKIKGQDVYDNTKQLEYFEKFWKALPLAAAPVVDLANDDIAPF
jgi:hypothetical protein